MFSKVTDFVKLLKILNREEDPEEKYRVHKNSNREIVEHCISVCVTGVVIFDPFF